ncbi:hypothetical protein D5R40_30390 [Okeania hirsuta]|uniref:Uncharacterized protein n=1 Tax=Okeania hirsuta TaxID=1458930 RepID=A0A3N6NZC7_9CYAN|nr:hypothetical protein [Okeania hirsuta]RQH23325.1 hypothetical protein D5R40_30390 [Okeania hirsuta]
MLTSILPHGNFDGVGGSVNNIQYEGINGDPNLILNLGGASGDTSISNAMDAPVISICGRNDPLTPDSVGVCCSFWCWWSSACN